MWRACPGGPCPTNPTTRLPPSPAFRSLHRLVGPPPAIRRVRSSSRHGLPTNRQWMTQIYTDVVGRTTDPSGVDYWTG
jgi:hypothetical protein